MSDNIEKTSGCVEICFDKVTVKHNNLQPYDMISTFIKELPAKSNDLKSSKQIQIYSDFSDELGKASEEINCQYARCRKHGLVLAIKFPKQSNCDITLPQKSHMILYDSSETVSMNNILNSRAHIKYLRNQRPSASLARITAMCLV